MNQATRTFIENLLYTMRNGNLKIEYYDSDKLPMNVTNQEQKKKLVLKQINLKNLKKDT